MSCLSVPMEAPPTHLKSKKEDKSDKKSKKDKSVVCDPSVDGHHKKGSKKKKSKKESQSIEVTSQGTKKVVISASEGEGQKEDVTQCKEGKLKLKMGSIAYMWKSVRVALEEKYILLYEKKRSEPTQVLPLHVCNVRPVGTRRFQLFCAPNTHLELRATDNTALREWVNLIQAGIMRCLSAQTENQKTSNSGMKLLSALRDANEANRVCADCNAADPKWISVSIGCIICIECSGVHRQLGATVSKVRSFELDIWNEKTEMVEKIGNADINSAFEANILPGHKKPTKDAEREERERYIYNKYVCKLYKRKPTVISRNPMLHKRLASVVQVTPKIHTQKRNSKPAIHIGSDMFSPQFTAAKIDRRRPSLIPTTEPPKLIPKVNSARRGSEGSVLKPIRPNGAGESPIPQTGVTPVTPAVLKVKNERLVGRRFSVQANIR